MVQDQYRIFINSMLHKVSQGNNQLIENQGRRRSHCFKEEMLSFMGENKRLLNIHEQKCAKLATFQANTIVF